MVLLAFLAEGFCMCNPIVLLGLAGGILVGSYKCRHHRSSAFGRHLEPLLQLRASRHSSVYLVQNAAILPSSMSCPELDVL